MNHSPVRVHLPLTFVALRTGPSVGTLALAVVGPAGAVVQAGAMLGTGDAPRVGRTRHRAVVARPTGQTAAIACTSPLIH